MKGARMNWPRKNDLSVALWASVLLALAAAGPEAQPVSTGPVNLLKNGGFESGEKCPDGWLIRFARKDLSDLTDIRRVDDLTIFWDDKAGTPGKCIRMDTDVSQREVHRRMEQLIAHPDAAPWPKTPTKPPKYDTAAGLQGVTFWSDPIPVEKGKMYRLSVDAKGRMAGIFFPKVFVRGFGQAPMADGTIRERRLYDTYLACRLSTLDKWRHFEQTLRPTDRTPAVTHVRVMLMAYWPPGEYLWDNVRLEEVPADEAARIRVESAREVQEEPPRPTPKPHRVGESFVIEEEEPLELPEK